MILAVFDTSPLTVCINCSFYIYICCLLPVLSRLLIMCINTTFFDFSRWRCPPSWIFKSSTAGLVWRANMRYHAKCCAERSNHCRYIVSFIFRMSAATVLDFFKFQISNRTNSHEGRTASPCQMSLKWLKLRPRYGDYLIFQDGGRRHVGFLELQISNCRAHHKCRIASPCQISWRLVKLLSNYLDFGFFFKMAAATILDF